jgi:hypothetical protein
MVETHHKFNLYDIANEFKIVLVGANHKFHIKSSFNQLWLQIFKYLKVDHNLIFNLSILTSNF